MIEKFVPVLCVAIAGGIFFGYINPTVTGQITEVNQEIAKYDSALQAAKLFQDKAAQLTREKQALPQDALVRLDAFLPDGVDNVQLILDLDALAARSGMKLANFTTTESGQAKKIPSSSENAPVMVVESGTGTDSVDISMTGSGSYGALRSFLDGVETSLRPLDLVEFQVSDSSANSGEYTYQMTYRLYWLR